MGDSSNQKLALDLDYVRGCYVSLTGMNVDLDANPLEYGPKRLNNKVAETRNALTKCEQMGLEVAETLHWLKRQLMQEELTFDLKVKDMMANDPEVRSGRNVSDRESVAHTKLANQRHSIASLKISIHDCEALQSIIRAKRTDLKDIQGRLRDQRNLCMDEIGLGSQWGSKRYTDGTKGTGVKLEPNKYTSPTSDMDQLIADVEGEMHLSDGVLKTPSYVAEDDNEDDDNEDDAQEDSDDEDRIVVAKVAGRQPLYEAPVIPPEDLILPPTDAPQAQEDVQESSTEVGLGIFMAKQEAVGVVENTEIQDSDESLDQFADEITIPEGRPSTASVAEMPFDLDALLIDL